MAAVCAAELRRRRKLRSVAKRVSHDGQLMVDLIRVAQEIRGMDEVDQILQVAATETGRALGVEQCAVLVEGENSTQPIIRSYDGDSENSSLMAERPLMEDLGTCVIALADSALEYYEETGSHVAGGRYPMLGVPVFQDGNFIGALLVRSLEQSRTWLETEREALYAVAHQISLAVKQARLLAQKEREASRDSLTGCLNRRAFEFSLAHELREAAESDEPLSLIMVDVDYFKKVNDSYGHPTGDLVLCMLANVLGEKAGSRHLVARFGGDEFALILPGHDADDAVLLAESIRTGVEGMKVPGIREPVTASFGVAAFPLHAASYDDLISGTDAALYEAKREGRNRVCTPCDNLGPN
jgi:diguanylate cyclase (GGDEF)-like protein